MQRDELAKGGKEAADFEKWYQLEDADYALLEVLEGVLENFSCVERLLEGSLYVTFSLQVPFLTVLARQFYEYIVSFENAHSTAMRTAHKAVVHIFTGLIRRFRTRLTFSSHEERENWLTHRRLPSSNNIAVYVSDAALVSTLLDPRFKDLRFLHCQPLEDKARALLLKEVTSLSFF